MFPSKAGTVGAYGVEIAEAEKELVRVPMDLAKLR